MSGIRLWRRIFRLLRRVCDTPVLPNVSGPICGQHYYGGWALGRADLLRAGCEVVAVYNALLLAGRSVPLHAVASDFAHRGYLMRRGHWGADPFAIGEYLHCRVITAVGELPQDDGVYILSYWNSRHIFNGLHTVTYVRRNGQTTVYNLHGNDRGPRPIADVIPLPKEGRFIVGYAVEQEQRV